MNIRCDMRDDGQPLLHLKAENDSDEETLERLRRELDHALDSARIAGTASDWGACGSFRKSGTQERRGALASITVGLLLGVHPSDMGHIKEGIRAIRASR